MDKDINISIDTIKRHAKRLHKTLKNSELVTQPFKLTQAQEIFAQALGCNNWFELNEILKGEVEPIKPLVMIIDSSAIIRGAMGLFLSTHYRCVNAQTTKEALEYLELSKKVEDTPCLILCDIDMEGGVPGLSNNGYSFIYNQVKPKKKYKNTPVIFLTKDSTVLPNGSKPPEFIDQHIDLLLLKGKIEQLIEYLKNYVNQHQGQVRDKYWNLLLKAYKDTGNEKEFNKIALKFSYTFTLPKPQFESFNYLPENNQDIQKMVLKMFDIHDDYTTLEDKFLCKPFTREESINLVKMILE